MMKLLLAIALVALATAVDTAHAERRSESAEPAAESPDRGVGDFVRLFFEERRYQDALDVISKVRVDPSDRRRAALVKALRATALAALDRRAEAETLFAEANALDQSGAEISDLEYLAGLMSRNPRMSLRALDRMIARFPYLVYAQDRTSVFHVLNSGRTLDKAADDSRRIGLARIGFANDLPEGDHLAFQAIRALAERGDTASASTFLNRVDEPELVENLLMQRRYAPLWPKIEELAGPGLSKVRASSVATAQSGYFQSPDDSEKLAQYINALRLAGRLDEAIALRGRLPADRAAMSKADEQMGWAVNNLALALGEKGRDDDADRLFALLNEAPIENPTWRVSMVINRLGQLVERGQFDRALPLLEPARMTAAKDGSDYARQLVRRLSYCTLSKLGRTAEAATLRPALLKHAGDARSATIDGLLCAGDITAAEGIAREGLDDREFQEDFVRKVQPVTFTPNDPSVWDKGWSELRQRPAMAEAYARLGRDMPARFLFRTAP